MKDSEAKLIVLALLISGVFASAYFAPPEFRVYAIFGYIAFFVLVAYLRNGVAFGKRVYPWGIKYSAHRIARPRLFKKKPSKNGKQHHKRK